MLLFLSFILGAGMEAALQITIYFSRSIIHAWHMNLLTWRSMMTKFWNAIGIIQEAKEKIFQQMLLVTMYVTRRL